MGEHWAHNAAHITDGMDEEVFFINRLWTGFDSHHPLQISREISCASIARAGRERYKCSTTPVLQDLTHG